MNDFFSQLNAAANAGPSPTLLRQVREVPGVRETGKHRYALAPAISLRFEVADGVWMALLDTQGQLQRFNLQTPMDERKLINALKRSRQRSEED